MNHPNENEQIAQQPDSDYCSDIDDRDGNAQPVLRAHGGNDFVMVHHGDEWIELDLPADFAHSLGFLTDADFQAVLKSFSEFTNQQLSAVNCTANELQGNTNNVTVREIPMGSILIERVGILRNQLAYLLWRRAVLIKLGQFPPIQGRKLRIQHFAKNCHPLES